MSNSKNFKPKILFSSFKYETETQRDDDFIPFLETSRYPRYYSNTAKNPIFFNREARISMEIPDDLILNKTKDKRSDSLKTLYHEEISYDDFDDIDSMRTIKKSEAVFDSVSDVVAMDNGEPLTTQFLKLDFTPIKGVDDDEFNINKCAEFWKFIDNHPELNSFKVQPDVNDDSNSTDSIFTTTTTAASTAGIATSNISQKQQDLTPLTILALNWLKRENVMTDSLATRSATRPCEETSKDYVKYYQKNKGDDWPSGTKLEPKEIHSVPYLASASKLKSRSQIRSTTSQVDELARMMAEMHKWDLEHPKSMEPPLLKATLMNVKNERKRHIVPYIDTDGDMYCEKCLN